MKKAEKAYLENNHQHENYFPDTFPSLRKCPFCAIARPTLVCKYRLSEPSKSEHFGMPICWAVYQCTSCSMPISLLYSEKHSFPGTFKHEYLVFPGAWSADSNIPESATRYLIQAQDTISSPDASVVMSAAAIDAMLKKKGLVEGNLYSRIDKAVDKGLLTKDMSEWAHLVRLNSNNPRHADKEKPHVSKEEALLSLDFAKALADVLFVLPSRMPTSGENERDDN